MTRTICFLCLLIAFTTGPAHAQEEAAAPAIEVTTEVDKERVTIGDRIKIDVIATKPEGYEVLFPDISTEQEYVSFIKSYPIEVKPERGGPPRVGREYVISIYDTGTHVIPPIPVKYRKQGEEEWKVTESSKVPIEVVSLVTDEDTDIKDLKALIVFGISKFWKFVFLVVLLAAGIGSYLWWRCKVKGACEETEAKEKTSYQIAYDELMELKAMDLPGKGKIEEYYIRLSDIVRHYLERRFAFKAPEMTTEEFMITLKASPEVASEHKKLLKEFLSHCDMVKFAKYGPTPLEMVDSFNAALNLVEQTRLIEEEEEEG